MSFDLTDWATLKTLRAIAELAKLADLANDPRTDSWYADRIRSHLHGSLLNHLKVFFWLDGGGSNKGGELAWKREYVDLVNDRGTLGLCEMLRQAGVSHNLNLSRPRYPDQDDESRPAPSAAPVPVASGPAWTSHAGVLAVGRIFAELARAGQRGLGPRAGSMLADIGDKLMRSEYPDMVELDSRFLDVDSGGKDGDGGGQPAIDELVEREILRLVEGVRECEPGSFFVQVVLPGTNDRPVLMM